MKLDVNALRYLTKEDFRVLTAVEMGQKNVRLRLHAASHVSSCHVLTRPAAARACPNTANRQHFWPQVSCFHVRTHLADTVPAFVNAGMVAHTKASKHCPGTSSSITRTRSMMVIG
jgi:hypothetical protein